MQNTLREIPATRPIRRRLLGTAIEGLREVADGPDSSTPDLRRAVAHRKLGDLYREVGDVAQARTQYESCLRVAGGLLAASPRDPEVLGCLAMASGELGKMSLQEDRREPAKELLSRSVDLANEWVAVDPKGSLAAAVRLVAYVRVGHAHLWCGEVAEARAAFETVLNLARATPSTSPEDNGVLRAVCQAETFLGDADRESGNSEGFRTHYRAAARAAPADRGRARRHPESRPAGDRPAQPRHGRPGSVRPRRGRPDP